MEAEYCYVAYNHQLFASSDNSVPKALRKKRQLNIRLKLREVVILRTSDETPSRDDDKDVDVLNALKLCDDGLAEIIEDVTTPELFKSFDLSLHAYIQRFEFYKALSDMGLGGDSYTHLRDELVKIFDAFADSLCKNHGVTRACSFTANLFAVKVDFVSTMMGSRHDHNEVVDQADMSSIGSSNCGDGFVDDKGRCNSSVGSNCLKQ